MGHLSQLELPRLGRVPVVNTSKPKQPRLLAERPLKKFEILHHPFNLRFRGRVHLWIDNLIGRNVSLRGVLGKNDSKLVELYFYPQSKTGRWLTQKQVAKELKLKTKQRLRPRLVLVLVTLWDNK